ncbi:OmpW/AlkL family protein [Variovorax sp. HJSM1_2]|uniref:OmpW/AlkL family protein n=1 Tax=Variovorax sp. HJSM1_2 TaxID=3366263 RepID=UPI003BE1D1DB
MKTRPHSLALAGLVLSTLAATGTAHAQAAGSWMVRGGVTHLMPDVDSGYMTAPSLPGTQVDVGNDTKLSGGVTYMLTDNWAIDLPLALPFKHEIVGAGAIAGVGTLGTVKALPITLFMQYRFAEANTSLRPYLGAGLTYSKLYDETGSATLSGITGGSPSNPTLLSADSRFGLTLQAGLTYRFDEHWFVDGAVVKSFVKTKATLSTGQTIDVKLNPLVLMLGVGYKF